MLKINPELYARKLAQRLPSLLTLLIFFWAVVIVISAFYLGGVYFLPFLGVYPYSIVTNRFFIESILCILLVSSGTTLAYARVNNLSPSITLDDEFLILEMDNRYVGVICLNVTAVSGSSITKGEPLKYNTSQILAIRSGLDKSINYAYQYGVKSGEPFLRYFISTTSGCKSSVKDTLRREATRTEAILLSTLEGVDIQLLRGIALLEKSQEMFGIGITEDGTFKKNVSEGKTLLQIQGNPRVTPTETSSQVGTFISTVLRQGYSVSLTCIFSKAKSGRESKKLERRWRGIRLREKQNNDSLADQTMKSVLMKEFEEISTSSAWFEVSTYVILDENTPVDGVKGLIHSVWGGDENLVISERQITQEKYYRLFLKRHLKKQRIHANRLVAYVNTPIQQIPVLSSTFSPGFQIPPSELTENELEVGWAIYGNRRLGVVGLKLEWLREHMAVMGATGTGKTNVVKKLMAEITLKTKVPWWIFDFKGSEYSDLSRIDDVIVLRPGLDPTFVIDLVEHDSAKSGNGHSTFTLLRELLHEGNSSELSPAMEKLLREAVLTVARNKGSGKGVKDLVSKIEEISTNGRSNQMTSDALLNRLEILLREPLGSILSGGPDALKISDLLSSRVVFDLRYVSRKGGLDAARLLYNLVAKRIFDASMKRGIVEGLHHLVVLEEASNLVPESYTRHSAADVTTGESMVMLQRATGQGVIVVSTRPNISTNILANTSTKITFRLPFDSLSGSRFMSINSDQEQYLRTMRRGRALVLLPNSNAFEIETEPFGIDEYVRFHTSALESSDTSIEADSSEEIIPKTRKIQPAKKSDTRKDHKVPVFDKMGELTNQIIALLASREITTYDDIRGFLTGIDSRITDEDIKGLLQDLVSLSTIQREAIPLVPGGFVYAPFGNGLSAVRKVIINYLRDMLCLTDQDNVNDGSNLDLIVNDTAIVIFPEQIKASSLDSVVDKVRYQMSVLKNGVSNLVIIVRGSVAAARLRDYIEGSDEFDNVSVVSAFPSSLSRLVSRLFPHRKDSDDSPLLPMVAENGLGHKGVLQERVPTSGHASEIRLWFGLIQEFIELSHGSSKWELVLEFIKMTASRSKNGRSIPLTVEGGERALTELLADEVLVAMRVGTDNNLCELDEGLWIANINVLSSLKTKAVEKLKNELIKKNGEVFMGHGYYDICCVEKSFVIFPTQQELTTLIQVHSDIACRKCGSREVVCVLTATEYIEDSIVLPSNLTVRTIDEGIAAIVY